jgi:hypothetical protein
MTEKSEYSSVTVIKTGEAEVPAPEVYWMQGWDMWERLSFHAVLVESEETNLLINTGMPENLSERNSEMVKFAGERCRFVRHDIVNELRSLGIDPSEIQNVAFTPIQDYTVGGLKLFRNSRIHVNRKGWVEDVTAPSHSSHLSRNLIIPEYVLKYLILEAWNRIQFFDAIPDFQLLPGISVRWVGCHHRSSLAFIINTSSGKVIFTDCSFKSGNIEEDIPIGIAESILECHDAYSALRGMGKVLSAYDPGIDGFRVR